MKVKKCDRINYTPREVCELINANAEKKHPVLVTPVETDMITGFSTWWPARYKKTSDSFEIRHLPRNEKQMFSISEYHFFLYSHENKGVKSK